ncbi:MAG: N-acetyltransferase family protein [Aggregatilineales bacterium]
MTPIIRQATPEDATQILEIYAPIVEQTTISFEISPPSVGEIAERIIHYTEKYPWLVLMDGDNLMGYAYGSTHRARAAYQWSVEVSVYTHENYRRRGVGYAAYKTLLDVLRLQGFYNAYAGITLPNDPSEGFHRALDFQPIGVYHNIGYKHLKWCDVAWYELALQDYGDNPQPPTPIGEVLSKDAYLHALESGLTYLK